MGIFTVSRDSSTCRTHAAFKFKKCWWTQGAAFRDKVSLYLDAVVGLNHVPHLSEHALAGFGLLRQAPARGARDELADARHSFVRRTYAVDDDLQR